jgi:hypothetical protein
MLTASPSPRRNGLAPKGPNAERFESRAYYLYGLCLRSEWPLPYPRTPAPFLADVRLNRGTSSDFADALKEVHAETEQACTFGVPLADGRTYLRWPDAFEFLISADGRTIVARSFRRSSREAFHTYLLGQALSFALVKQGLDPLHATVVLVDGVAVAFLGDSGYGKSSLSAAFVQAGHRLLTDDLLVLSEHGAGFIGYPGPPRIKLFPKMARIVLRSGARGTRISNKTLKLLIPLGARQTVESAAPLGAAYVISRPGNDRTHVTIRRLTKRRACLALLRNTFNTSVTDAGRLTRQFSLAAKVAVAVPVSSIAYPRSVRLLPAVKKAILADLTQ